MITKRIGAYGGTFDPIHVGHVEVARALTLQFRLDELQIIPALRPPHKDPRSISDAYHRYAMAVLATEQDERIKVSAIELEEPEKPYTFETIRRLKELYGPNTKLYFIMGSDSFAELKTWREPSRVLTEARIIVAARPGWEASLSAIPAAAQRAVIDLRQSKTTFEDRDIQDGTIFITDFVRRDLSSSEIRERVRLDSSIDGLVPTSVGNYISKYGLYKNNPR